MDYWTRMFFRLPFILLLLYGPAHGSPDNCSCPRRFKPVCGTDGETYNSPCHLGCESTVTKGLRLAYKGTCCPKPICPPVQQPICDSDGHTHENECMFRYAFCVLRKTEGRLVRVVKSGPCAMLPGTEVELCDLGCEGSMRDPVCDTAGDTHQNLCWLSTAQCLARRDPRATPTLIAYTGPCVILPPAPQSTSPPLLSTRSVVHTPAPTTSTQPQPQAEPEPAPAVPEPRASQSVHPEPTLPEPESLPSPAIYPEPSVLTELEPTILPEPEPKSPVPEPEGSADSEPVVFVMPEAEEWAEHGGVEVWEVPEAEALPPLPAFVSTSGAILELPPEEHRAPSIKETSEARMCSAALCTKNYQPVCDNRGRTHVNPCVFEFSSCLQEQAKGAPLHVVFLGECSRAPQPAPKSVPESEPSSEPGSHSEPQPNSEPEPTTEPEPSSEPEATPQGFDLHSLANTQESAEQEPRSEPEPTPEGERLLPPSPPPRHRPPIANSVPVTTPPPSAPPSLCPLCAQSERELFLICDNTNTTHQNLCFFNAASCRSFLDGRMELLPVHFGPCDAFSITFPAQEEVCPERCTLEYYPICDGRNRTHGNLCAFQAASCRLRKQTGECGRPLEVPLLEGQAAPALPTDSSHWDWWTQSLPRPSHPSQRLDCPEQRCPNLDAPVCDSEGKTHANVCEFTRSRCVAAQGGRVLSLLHEGACLPDDCRHLLQCPHEFRPVCGSDFETYWNLCVLKQHQCKEREGRGTGLEVLFPGDCADCITNCGPEEDAALVCDSLGDTHSLCQFRMASCIYKKKFGLDLVVEHEGGCCPNPAQCPISPEDKIICDANGVEHGNECVFQAEACRWERQTRTALGRGVCGAVQFRPPVFHRAAARRQFPDSLHTGEALAFEHKELVLSPTPRTQPQSCGQVDEEAVEATTKSPDECPDACENVYQPVCGSDGVTYTNRCFLTAAACRGVAKPTLAYSGTCCDVKCPKNWSPVCDSDGHTHLNLCEFGKARCLAVRRERRNLELTTLSICLDSPCREIACPKDYKPLCGSDGRTYANDCEVKRSACLAEESGRSLEIQHSGPCCEDNCDSTFQHEPALFEPVCDEAGATHANPCALGVAQCKARARGGELQMRHPGVCCELPCTAELAPVCDGRVTHPNLCYFKVAQCEASRAGQELSVVHGGECCGSQEPGGECPSQGPVCDSSGRTHPSLCAFNYTQCVLAREKGQRLHILHKGECCPEPSECGLGGAERVCDSRGHTHHSVCHYSVAKCRQEALGGLVLEIAYNGMCCDRECPAVIEPQCDQHGRMYDNRCRFEEAACVSQRSSGKRLLLTPCPKRRFAQMKRREAAGRK